MLTAKFVACKIPVPQMSPKNSLRFGCLLSQQGSAIHENSLYLPKLPLKRRTKIPSPQSSPRKRGEAEHTQSTVRRRYDTHALRKLPRNGERRLHGISHEVLDSRKLSELECDASSHCFHS